MIVLLILAFDEINYDQNYPKRYLFIEEMSNDKTLNEAQLYHSL